MGEYSSFRATCETRAGSVTCVARRLRRTGLVNQVEAGAQSIRGSVRRRGVGEMGDRAPGRKECLFPPEGDVAVLGLARSAMAALDVAGPLDSKAVAASDRRQLPNRA